MIYQPRGVQQNLKKTGIGCKKYFLFSTFFFLICTIFSLINFISDHTRAVRSMMGLRMIEAKVKTEDQNIFGPRSWNFKHDLGDT